MDIALLDDIIESLEKLNASLEPEVLPLPRAREVLAKCARGRKLFDFTVATLARRVDDAAEVARATGTSMGAAKTTVATGKMLDVSDALSMAFQAGDVSLDQAAEIAKAEESAPGAARELLPVAQSNGFHVLKDKARAIRLEAEQHRDLAIRQRQARFGRSYSDDLGMVHVHLSLEPHVGADRGPGRGRGAAPREEGEGGRRDRAVRALPGRRLREPAVGLGQGSGQAP